MKVIPTITDQAAERQIADLDLQFTKKQIAYRDIDIAAGLENMARTDDVHGKAIDPLMVEQYYVNMKQGDIFPSPVLLARDGMKYLPIGGNQRFAAWKKFAEGCEFEILSYIVKETDVAARYLLPRLLNRMHGIRSTPEQLLSNALYAHREMGWPTAKAEQKCGVPAGSLNRHIKFIEAQARVKAIGLKPDKISKYTLVSANTIKNDNVFSEAAELLCEIGPKSDDAKKLVDMIKRERTELAQLSVVREQKKLLAPAIGQVPPASYRKKPARTGFLIALKALESAVRNKTTLAQLQITDLDEQKTVSQRIAKLTSSLRKLCHPGKNA